MTRSPVTARPARPPRCHNPPPAAAREEPRMIHVRNLTKYYGDYVAVRDVSFEVARGQVVGFLGPNGAGKSTTLRILVGFLGATSGRARIEGHDIAEQPDAARRALG